MAPLNPIAISIGESSSHSYAILENDQLKCWGLNNNGQVGIGNTTVPNDQIGDSPDELGDNMRAVDFGTQDTCRALLHIRP
ncbi:MAG: RCC1 domain-containing protein [Bacteroidota bacterium]